MALMRNILMLLVQRYSQTKGHWHIANCKNTCGSIKTSNTLEKCWDMNVIRYIFIPIYFVKKLYATYIHLLFPFHNGIWNDINSVNVLSWVTEWKKSLKWLGYSVSTWLEKNRIITLFLTLYWQFDSGCFPSQFSTSSLVENIKIS